MDTKQVKKIAMDVERDMRNQSRESLIHTFNDLFFEHKQEVKNTVESTIKIVVNGKIDKIQKDLTDGLSAQIEVNKEQQKVIQYLTDSLEKMLGDMKDVHQILITARGTKTFIAWVAGIFGGIAIIGAGLKYLIFNILSK